MHSPSPSILAVRYCGGCRSSYDRAALLSELINELAAQGLFVVPEYDAPGRARTGLLICGCQTCCPETPAGETAWLVIGPGPTLNANAFDRPGLAAALARALRVPRRDSGTRKASSCCRQDER